MPVLFEGRKHGHEYMPMPPSAPQFSYDCGMRRLFDIASLVSVLLCVLCFFVAFSCYRLFVEGTIDSQNQIIHDPWLAASARRYATAACVFAIMPLIRLFRPPKRTEQ
jgi:hypothetical protein